MTLAWLAQLVSEEPATAVPFSEQPLIRVIMLSGLAAIGYLVFLRRNKLPFHIVTVFGLLGAGVLAVMFPGATDDIAHYVGVGRGVDLITYILEIAVLFVLIHYYTKFVELQRQITVLTREMAILKAEREQPSGATNGNDPHGVEQVDRQRAADR